MWIKPSNFNLINKKGHMDDFKHNLIFKFDFQVNVYPWVCASLCMPVCSSQYAKLSVLLNNSPHCISREVHSLYLELPDSARFE